MQFLTDFKKEEVFNSSVCFFFVCLLRDYAANYESILMIFFLLGRVDLRSGPILILSKLI